jgi:hypothetical protein
MSDKRLPRGIRNNNPGNIRKSADMWQGVAGDDGTFAKFESPKWGIRAMAKLLINYQKKHRLDTIEEIIHRWAPPVENHTDSYVDVVATKCGVDPQAKVDLTNPELMLNALKAMITVENGQQPYSDEELRAGMTLAGIDCASPAPKVKPLIKSRTVQGVAVAGAGTLLTWLTDNQEVLTTIAALLSQDLALAVPKIMTFLGLAYSLYARWDDHRKGVK